ncbi:hypothetical protein KKC17_00690 [Patescibacteria group bacterium]|nr:hypothetical protein [Patescibacteria group bacterium]
MHFSALQKYILKSCYLNSTAKVPRLVFMKYYQNLTKAPKHDAQVGSVTKSLESLIDRSLLKGYGVRTPRKWFISEIKLTAVGKKVAKRLIGQQPPLPLPLKKLILKK